MIDEPHVAYPPLKANGPSAPQGAADHGRTPERLDHDPARHAAADITEPARVNRRRTGKNILLAEDSDDMRDVLAMRLRRAGYFVVECRDGSELVRALVEYLGDVPREMKLQSYDLLISDVRMPGISGLSVAEAAYDCRDFPPTILITAFGDEETHQRALQSGVAAVFDKPFDIDDLLRKVRDVLLKSPRDLLPSDE